MPKAIVLLSGGIDSAVAMLLACDKHGPDVLCLAFDYGQRHAVEIEAAAELAAWRGLTLEILEVPPLLFGNSPILKRGNEAGIPTTVQQTNGPTPVVVPFRNGILLSIATSQAIAYGATEVWAGYHKSDWQAGAFPDCSPRFVHAMSMAMEVGSVYDSHDDDLFYREVSLYTPLLDKTKVEIVEIAIERHLPLKETVSCYRGRPACRTCPTCRQRLEAFEQLGQVDPIQYVATPA
jgi:7-cyano-7-deazaguanine synthase